MFVFFFKQKTAYEMRISDWSSDVCSSDLGALHEPVIQRGMTPVIERGDLVIDVQAFGQRNAARGHGNGQRRRSAIPEWFALHKLRKGRRRRGRRIEKMEDRKSTRLNSSH